MSRNEEITSSLVDLVYSSLLGETSWQDFLDALGRTVPAGKSMMFFHDAKRPGDTFAVASGLDQSMVRDYNSHYFRINPWMPAASVRKVGVGVTAEEMLPAAALRRTEFYDGFVRGIRCETAVGVTIVREEGCSFLLSTLTSQADPNDNIQAAARLSVLAPHLQRAFRHYRVGPSNRAIAEIGGSLFDAVDIGVVVLGAGGAVKAMSRSAERMSDEPVAAIVRSRGGGIRIKDADLAGAVSRMLDRSYAGPRTLTFGLSSLRVTAVQAQKDRFATYFEGPTVVLLMEPIDRRWRPGGDLAREFGLTAAETRVLEGIASGKRLYQIAAELGRSSETIRTQAKGLYRKLAVSGQLELLSKVRQFESEADKA